MCEAFLRTQRGIVGTTCSAADLPREESCRSQFVTPGTERELKGQPMLTLKKIVLREIRLRLKEPFRISSGVVDERRILLLELHDADGAIEWSECVAGEWPNYSYETIDTAWLAIREWLAPRVLGTSVRAPGSPRS